MSLYRKPKRPFEIGELRMKTWRTLETTVSQNDPTWQARCEQYWNLQARLYGIRLSDIAMIVNNNEGFVSTFSVVMEILPGERTEDYSRVPVESAQIASMNQ